MLCHVKDAALGAALLATLTLATGPSYTSALAAGIRSTSIACPANRTAVSTRPAAAARAFLADFQRGDKPALIALMSPRLLTANQSLPVARMLGVENPPRCIAVTSAHEFSGSDGSYTRVNVTLQFGAGGISDWLQVISGKAGNRIDDIISPAAVPTPPPGSPALSAAHAFMDAFLRHDKPAMFRLMSQSLIRQNSVQPVSEMFGIQNLPRRVTFDAGVNYQDPFSSFTMVGVTLGFVQGSVSATLRIVPTSAGYRVDVVEHLVGPAGSNATAPGLAIFTSTRLGISFDYRAGPYRGGQTVHAKAVGNRVYVYAGMPYQEGQWVEARTKRSTQSLQDAIRTQLLTGYSPANCVIRSGPWHYSTPTYTVLEIVPTHVGPGGNLGNTCPPAYTAGNGISYFLSDSRYPERYLYFAIGQYPIDAGPGQAWQDTIRFLP